VPSEPPPPERLGILLISGSHERAHYALVLATGAAALGREVVVFATNAGCQAFLEDWSALADAGRDAAVRASGVAGLAELRAAAQELGVRMIACEAGLEMAGLSARKLAAGVERAGVATFLEAARGGQLLTL
jgi:peroxiredoxin family protein